MNRKQAKKLRKLAAVLTKDKPQDFKKAYQRFKKIHNETRNNPA